jgi:DNA processing protein
MDFKTLLAIQKIPKLRFPERILLSELIGENFSELNLEDLQEILRRPLNLPCFDARRIMIHAQREFDLCEEYGISMLWVTDKEYPPQLREIHNPPAMLFYRGTLPVWNKPQVAIVGTRRPNGRGVKLSYRLGFDFGSYHIPVVSGLAYGVDASAHKGVLDAAGTAIAVLGSGLDKVYPQGNAALASSIIKKGGCIMSEYPPGVLPLKHHFPARNRIIAGLSRAVVVAQAPESSGALITAQLALDEGRDVAVLDPAILGSEGKGWKESD